MATYRYRARDNQGALLVGQLEAASENAVANQLFNSGITPIEISETNDSGLLRHKTGELQLFERRVSDDDLIMFSRQMYSLTRAGVPIIRAMTGIAERARTTRLRRVLRDVVEHLDNGRSLAEAMRQHPDVFSQLYVSIIQVAENSGRLDEGFDQISRHLELDKDTRDRLRTALRYPMIVLTFIVAAIVAINLKVIPEFANVFANVQMELPWATRLLLGVSGFMVEHWLLLIVAALMLVGGAAYYISTPAGAYRWDRLKLRLPIVGGVITRATLARFSRAFAVSTRAGVPLIQALSLVSRAVDNQFVAERILSMRNGIERGESLGRTAAATAMFTPLVQQMIDVGEETGQVEEMLLEVAQFYEREVDYDLKRMSSYIEPVLIAGIGVIVLVLALGVFLPMWELTSAVRGS